jgi:hypothetical protein
MFLLYHSKRYNIYESVLRECYVNDLYTIICNGVLDHYTNGGAARGGEEEQSTKL